VSTLTRKALGALRSEARRRLAPQDSGGVHIIVGMGTSGIAAGARETLEAFRKECAEHNLGNVVIRQTGSLGLDHAEPTAEVRMVDMPTVIYGRVTPDIAAKIVRKHILGKALINDHIYDHPAVDITNRQERV
jgi:NADP-reducing hydrogenase subunit HndB